MQGGNTRESTVAKMREEVEAHAQYERAAALARSSGSRRLPKLRPSLSSPTGWALAIQQSIPLHQLMEKHSSNAASTAQQLIVPAQNTEQLHAVHGAVAAMHVQDKDLAKTPSRQAQHISQTGIQQQRMQQPQQQQSLVMGREAQLLLGPLKPPPANQSHEPPSDIVNHTKLKAADLGEAVVFEEKYHRAGREVLGQHVDTAAAVLAATEHAKRHVKAEKLRLGYTPLKHKAALLDTAASSSSHSPPSTHKVARNFFNYASAI